MPVCPVLEYGGKPWWAVRQFFDLNGLIHDQAVRAQPAPGAHGEILHLPVAYMADVRLSVHRERSLFPGIDLELGHANQSLLRGQIIGEWTGDVVGENPYIIKSIYSKCGLSPNFAASSSFNSANAFWN